MSKITFDSKTGCNMPFYASVKAAVSQIFTELYITDSVVLWKIQAKIWLADTRITASDIHFITKHFAVT